MCANYSGWDDVYQEVPLNELGWELGKPRPILIEYLKKGFISKGKALDLCCGAGTNTLCISQSGFDTTAMDISKTALRIAERKVRQAKAAINFLEGSFVNLPFDVENFDFVFDMGCFHHVEVEDRTKFISGLHRVLKCNGVYMLTCFSHRNGSSWNHFTRQQIVELFSDFFELGKFRHYPSLEGDYVIRFFYTVLMKKKFLE
jgi:ubiquinone/menaquinone biosynthesis C-methylase UbiE